MKVVTRNGEATFRVRVVPRASRNEIVGVQGEALKVRLAAPPVEGRANEALVTFLAEVLGLRPRQVRVLSGHTGREKVIAVAGIEARELARRIAAALKSSKQAR